MRSTKDDFQIGLRVVRWVTTGEHKLLYVFLQFFAGKGRPIAWGRMFLVEGDAG